MKSYLKGILRIRPALALMLTFWCAGAGCMLVSARTAALDSGMSAQLSAGLSSGASGSMGSHACCKARHKASMRDPIVIHRARHSNEDGTVTLPSNPAPSGAMSCCPLTSGSIVIASRSQASDDNSTVTESSDSQFALTRSGSSPLVVPLRLPNRAQSYLLDCAFLI